jgi:hypothetical protein
MKYSSDVKTHPSVTRSMISTTPMKEISPRVVRAYYQRVISSRQSTPIPVPFTVPETASVNLRIILTSLNGAWTKPLSWRLASYSRRLERRFLVDGVTWYLLRVQMMLAMGLNQSVTRHALLDIMISPCGDVLSGERLPIVTSNNSGGILQGHVNGMVQGATSTVIFKLSFLSNFF